MLGNTEAIPNIAVKNLDVARKFYQDTLGLQQVHNEDGDLVVFKSGNSAINVYQSSFAGTNKATAMTWAVADVDAAVRTLKSKGVSFEHYDMPGMTREGDIHVAASRRVAWFKDPDGNILNLINN